MTLVRRADNDNVGGLIALSDSAKTEHSLLFGSTPCLGWGLCCLIGRAFGWCSGHFASRQNSASGQSRGRDDGCLNGQRNLMHKEPNLHALRLGLHAGIFVTVGHHRGDELVFSRNEDINMQALRRPDKLRSSPFFVVCSFVC